MRGIRKLLLVTLGILALTAGPAWADTEEDGQAPVPTAVRSFDATLTAAAGGSVVHCWGSDYWVQRQRRSSIGVLLWYYRLTITDFCWGGNKIVLARSVRKVGGPFVPCWDFVNHVSNQINWNAKWTRVQTIEGKFTWLCPPLVYSRTPEVTIGLRGDGYHWKKTGD